MRAGEMRQEIFFPNIPTSGEKIRASRKMIGYQRGAIG